MTRSAGGSALPAGLAPASVERWVACEIAFSAEKERESPFWDVDVRVELVSPSGRAMGWPAFWDGDRTWRARLRLDEVGEWRWRSTATDDSDRGLHGRSGTLVCVPYEGGNPVFRHGPARVAESGTSLCHDDGTPFLWLGDTVWNGLIRATPSDWEAYLELRRAQGFTVVSCFSSQWRALAVDPAGEPSFMGEGRTFRPNPRFYRRLDEKVEAVARHGLLLYAIVVLSLYEDEPGWAWPAEQLTRFASWLRARWGAWHMAWTLAGDGRFAGPAAEARFRPIGRAVYANPPERLVTMHPCGWTWAGAEFRDEPWLTFHSYQSCHSDDEAKVRWLAHGDVARDWAATPAKPIINLEPNYEDHPSYDGGRVFTAHEVRRAAYWSLFVAPTAGVNYGQYSLWAWASEPEPVGEAIRGQESLVLNPWRTVVDTAGAHSMTLVRRYLESGPWWELRPAQGLLADQPGTADVRRWAMAAMTGDGSWAAVYAPLGGRVAVAPSQVAGMSARWFDPRTGAWCAAAPASAGDPGVFAAPDGEDWILDFRA